MQFIIIILGISGLILIANAEEVPIIEWEKTFNGDTYQELGNSIQHTTDGGYIITGEIINGEDIGDVYLLKIHANGTKQWEKNFPESNDNKLDWGESVQQTTDGGYIITGTTYNPGPRPNIYLIKTDANGNLQWQKNYGGDSSDYGESVQQTTDGGYIITGFTYSYGTEGSSDIYLIKTDANGNELWFRSFGGNYTERGESVQQTTDGGYIIAGTCYYDPDPETKGGGHYNICLIKTKANGDLQWPSLLNFGGNADDYGYSVQQTTDGGYIITGSTDSYGRGDVYIIKTYSNGTKEWENHFGGNNSDYGESVQETIDGGYIIAGTYSYGTDNADVYLIRTYPNGTKQWEMTFGDNNPDYGHSVQQTNDGSYIVAGTKQYGLYGIIDTDVYLIKLKPWFEVKNTKKSLEISPALNDNIEIN